QSPACRDPHRAVAARRPVAARRGPRLGAAGRPHLRAAGRPAGAVRAAGRAPAGDRARHRRRGAGAPAARRGGGGLMRSNLRRLAQRARVWAERRLPALTRLRQPEPLPIELGRRRIYIVPTAFGLGFGVLLLLTCMLGAATAASMLLAFRTLDGLSLRGIRAGHAVAGEPLELVLDFAA